MNRAGHAYCDAGNFAKAKNIFEDEIHACAPGDPDIHLRTRDLTVDQEVDIIIDALRDRGVFD